MPPNLTEPSNGAPHRPRGNDRSSCRRMFALAIDVLSVSDFHHSYDAGFILEPQLYIRACREPGTNFCQLGWKSFLKSAIASSFCA